VPAIEDGFLPSEKLRGMEIEFNELFDAYREMYFEGGTSSVYLWDQDQGFAGCFLIKKSTFAGRLVCTFDALAPSCDQLFHSLGCGIIASLSTHVQSLVH
jgi:hypothetical protein